MVRLLISLLLCVGLTAGAQATTLIYQNDFDGKWPPQTNFQYIMDMNGNQVSWAFTFSSTHKRSGTHSARIENRPEGTSQDGGKRRREVEPRQSLQGENRVYLLENDHSWIGFSIMLDPNWASSMRDSGKEILILQNISRKTETSWKPEYHWILREDGRLRIERSWTDSSGNRQSSSNSITTLEPGKWYDIVIHRYRKSDSSGRNRLWIDGKLVSDITGPNMLWDYNLKGAIHKWGPYTGTDGTSTYVLYFDNMKVARGTFTDGYDAVNPAAGTSLQAPAPPQSLTLTRH
jgi:hypothetical protein